MKQSHSPSDRVKQACVPRHSLGKSTFGTHQRALRSPFRRAPRAWAEPGSPRHRDEVGLPEHPRALRRGTACPPPPEQMSNQSSSVGTLPRRRQTQPPSSHPGWRADSATAVLLSSAPRSSPAWQPLQHPRRSA